MTSVSIGKGIASIGNSAFGGCYKLNKIYCYATNPPILNGDAFSTNANKTLYVPIECGLKYKSSDWSDYFRNIIEME